MGPEFIIAGASKAATTWLAKCLAEHPDIYIPPIINTEFFTENYRRGAKWYSNKFKSAEESQIRGEKSTSYMVAPAAARRIHRWNKSCEMLFVLRNPVDRAYSHYCMDLRADRASADIHREISLTSRYVLESNYMEHIGRYEALFGEGRVSLFLFDDLVSDASGFLKLVYETLGVDKDFVPSSIDGKANPRRRQPQFDSLQRISRRIRERLREYDLGAAVLRKARDGKIGSMFHWIQDRGERYPRYDDRLKEKVALAVIDDVRWLEKRTGRPLVAKWLDDHLLEGS